MLPFRVRVDLGVVTIKEYSAFPEASHLREPHHQIFYTRWWGLTPMRRGSWCILRPQPTGPYDWRDSFTIFSIPFYVLLVHLRICMLIRWDTFVHSCQYFLYVLYVCIKWPICINEYILFHFPFIQCYYIIEYTDNNIGPQWMWTLISIHPSTNVTKNCYQLLYLSFTLVYDVILMMWGF